jgi:hypothetical protein
MNKQVIVTLLVIVSVPLGWYGYNKYIKAASLRAYAIEQCELKGGYHTKGPVTVPGYLINSIAQGDSEVTTIIEKLVIENYEFIEVPAEKAHPDIREIVEKKHTRSEDVKGIYYRFTLESNNSPLCKKFNAYREEGKQSYALAGLNLNQCIGINRLEDESLLRSKYEYALSFEYENKALIRWNANRVQHIATKKEASSYRSFGSCVTGRAASGEGARCNYGEENIINCPVNYDRDDPILFKKFRENAFVGSSSKPMRRMKVVDVSLAKSVAVKLLKAKLLEASKRNNKQKRKGQFLRTISEDGRVYIDTGTVRNKKHQLVIVDTYQRVIKKLDISKLTSGRVRFSQPLYIDGHIVFMATQNVYQANPSIVFFKINFDGNLISHAIFELPVSDIVAEEKNLWGRVEEVKKVEGGYEIVVPYYPPRENPSKNLTFLLPIN